MGENQETVTDFSGLRVLVVGLAREGAAVAAFVADHGALVTVTDARPADALAERLSALAERPIALALGGHPLSLLNQADILFVSPGVPLEIELLAEARRRGLPLSSESRLFARLCPALIVAITASSGKTTTTTLVWEMLKASGRTAWVGGNIGSPLLPSVQQIGAADVVVLELSSFQLDLLGPWAGIVPAKLAALFDARGWSPPVAGLLNVTPNHLDRHPSMESYIAAKSQILADQRPGDVAVLGLDNPVTAQIGRSLRSGQQVRWFSLEQEVTEGAFLRDDELVVHIAAREESICRTGELKLLGRHNVANVLAACALSASAGATVEAMRRVATSFSGVQHRLELVRKRHGVHWYNDSIATSPERTVAALQSFEAPIVLLAGGKDKNLPWDEMAALTCRKARHLVLFGNAAGLIESAMRRSPAWSPDRCVIHQAGTLEKAVQIASAAARPGDVVLLSPGGTSFDAYRDFAERGEHFRRLVEELE